MTSFTPRPFQVNAMNDISWLQSTSDRALLVLPPGGGKTLTFLVWALTQNQKFPIWVLVHEEDLLDQWLDNARQMVEWGFASSSDFCAVVGGESIGLKNKKFVGLKSTAQIIFCMDKRVDGAIDEAERKGLAPRMCCMDEFHLMIPRQGARSLRRWGWRTYGEDFFLLGLTGSPIAHEDEFLQPSHVVPRSNWITSTTPAELTRDGFWAKQEYVELPDEYLEKARSYFQGHRDEQPEGDHGDFLQEQEADLEKAFEGTTISTSGRAVMKALFEDHIQIILGSQRRANETALIFCADVKHCEEVSSRLTEEWGESIPIVVGKTKKAIRKKLLKLAKTGGVRAICLVGCWLSGIDLPNAKTGFFLVPCNSYPRFFQSATRLIRKGKEDCEGLTAQFYDLALNWGKHPLLQDCRFDPESPLFADRDEEFKDPHSRICGNPDCLFVHKAIPSPRKAGQIDAIDKNGDHVWLKADVKNGEYSDGSPIFPNDPLLCHECGHPVYGDMGAIGDYLDWQWNKKDREQPEWMGLSIGVQHAGEIPLNYGILEKLGFYSKGKPKVVKEVGGDPEIVDRSLEWDFKREVSRTAYKRAKAQNRVSVLTSPNVSQSGILGVTKAQTKDRSKDNFTGLSKALWISLTQAFSNAESIVPCYAIALLYPHSDFAYCENRSGESIVIAQNAEPPDGYKFTNATRSIALKTIFFQSFSRFLDYILDGSSDEVELLAVVGGWILEPLELLEGQLVASDRAGDTEKSKNLTETIDLLATCLELVRDCGGDF